MYQIYFLFSLKVFEVLFSFYRIIYIVCMFTVYEFFTIVFLCKSFYFSFFVLLYSSSYIVRHTNIENSWFTCHYICVEIVFFFHEKQKEILFENDKKEINSLWHRRERKKWQKIILHLRKSSIHQRGYPSRGYILYFDREHFLWLSVVLSW